MWHGLAELSRSLDIGQFVPEAYVEYRSLIADGFTFFLEHLPPIRVAEILDGQLALRPDATAAERLGAVFRCCPTLHKAGQVISRDRRLDPALRRALQQLESLPSRRTDAVWKALPATPELEIASEPLAEASVSVVIPVVWRPTAGPVQEGVLKVLKPGIAERLDEELELWPDLASMLEDHCATANLPGIPFRETLDRVRQLLRSEVRLQSEQSHLAEAAHLYADAAEVLIPRLLPFCSERITAMQRVHGWKVTEASLAAGARRRLADMLVTALLARPFWDRGVAALFHADPHAGNLFVTTDGRLAILDWSLAGRLAKEDRIGLTRVVIAAVALDASGMAKALAALSHGPVQEEAVRRIASEALVAIRQGRLPGLSWLVRLLDGLVLGGGQVSEDLLFFRKALLSLTGVVEDVCPAYNPDGALLAAGAQAFARELGPRLFAGAESRAFATHVSNGDLFRLWAVLPFVAIQRWAEWWQIALRAAMRA